MFYILSCNYSLYDETRLFGCNRRHPVNYCQLKMSFKMEEPVGLSLPKIICFSLRKCILTRNLNGHRHPNIDRTFHFVSFLKPT